MRRVRIPAAVPLAVAVVLGGLGAVAAPRSGVPGRTASAAAEEKSSRPTFDACASLNARTLGDYRDLLGKALRAAQADAKANGSTGAYAVAATNSRDLLQRAYDRATQMVDFNNTQGNRDPNSTTYVEAGNFKTYLQSILNWLPDAAHWASISAAYHRSRPASEVLDETTDAIESGGHLMGAAGACYIAPYMAGQVKAG